jgi:hypothetical protein
MFVGVDCVSGGGTSAVPAAARPQKSAFQERLAPGITRFRWSRHAGADWQDLGNFPVGTHVFGGGGGPKAPWLRSREFARCLPEGGAVVALDVTALLHVVIGETYPLETSLLEVVKVILARPYTRGLVLVQDTAGATETTVDAKIVRYKRYAGKTQTPLPEWLAALSHEAIAALPLADHSEPNEVLSFEEFELLFASQEHRAQLAARMIRAVVEAIQDGLVPMDDGIPVYAEWVCEDDARKLEGIVLCDARKTTIEPDMTRSIEGEFRAACGYFALLEHAPEIAERKHALVLVSIDTDMLAIALALLVRRALPERCPAPVRVPATMCPFVLLWGGSYATRLFDVENLPDVYEPPPPPPDDAQGLLALAQAFGVEPALCLLEECADRGPGAPLLPPVERPPLTPESALRLLLEYAVTANDYVPKIGPMGTATLYKTFAAADQPKLPLPFDTADAPRILAMRDGTEVARAFDDEAIRVGVHAAALARQAALLRRVLAGDVLAGIDTRVPAIDNPQARAVVCGTVRYALAMWLTQCVPGVRLPDPFRLGYGIARLGREEQVPETGITYASARAQAAAGAFILPARRFDASAIPSP